MFFTEVVNDWGELTYVPTTLTMSLLAILLVVALFAAAIIYGRYNRSDNPQDTKSLTQKISAKQLAFCAMSVALGTVLSNLKLFHFPTGGSITLLSMLVIALPGYFFGLIPGILAGIAYGLLQLIIDPYVLFPMQLVVDYILAFGALGLSGLFFNKTKFALLKGYIAAILGRYVFAVISGWIFFGSYAWEGWGALPYSLVYNGIYIFAEAILTIIIISLPPVKKAISIVRDIAQN